jgi:repressor LexA
MTASAQEAGMPKGKLSERQKRMLDFIQKFSHQSGYPPSIREIGEAVDISSTSVVNYNLNRLVEEGLVARDQNVSRGIRLTEKLARASERLTNVVRVPLVGRIFASQPVHLPSTDSPVFGADEAIEITRDLLTAQDGLFALQVKGDSMIDAMVNDGDIVVMKRQSEWRNGDMVAVWLSDREETTLKHIYRDGPRVRLQPANPTMKPIVIEDPSKVEVQGKVMLVVRQLN